MDFLSAAYRILENAGESLHYKVIARRALSNDLIETSGKTPEATMGARLYTDTKRENSRFEHVGRATFGLKRKARVDDIGRHVERLNESTRRTIKQRLHEMPADRFETLVGELLIQIGFNEDSVQVTSYSNDGGIDVRGILNAGDVTEVNAAVQVKRWKKNIQARTVRDVRGSLTTHEQGIIITTSDFSKGARAEANAIGKTPISLVHGQALVELLIKHSVGVSKERHTVFSLDEEWWAEISGVEDREVFDAEAKEVKKATVAFPITVRAMNNPDVAALLLNREGKMKFNNKEYKSAYAAGKAATGWKSCNGWKFWKYQHPDTLEWCFIDDLRAR